VRLNTASHDRLGVEVERPTYERGAQGVGIVHFGIGAFHRAHQAWYTDLAMEAGDRDWAIIGVSLRSPAVAEQLNPQDGLYTVSERSAEADMTRLIGAVRAVLVAPRERERVVAAIAAPGTRIVSLTVTEKGYCRGADGNLAPALADADSFYAYLLPALQLRREAGLPGLTLLSCDNLADNGRQLECLVVQYVERHCPELLPWVETECTFPSTMVDRIVPATTADDLSALADRITLDDAGAVMTEPFSQWVIEDRFAGPRPRWEVAGAELVSDVAPYEKAKLRMLNGAHSLLAYCGLARGYAFVHQAIADPELLGRCQQGAQGFQRGQCACVLGEGHEQARRVGGLGIQRAGRDDGGQLLRRHHDDRHLDLHLPGQCPGDGVGMLDGHAAGRLEHRIAAVEQRGHAGITEPGQQGAQFRHGHAVGLADIDAAQQGDEGGHANRRALSGHPVPLQRPRAPVFLDGLREVRAH